MVLASAIAGDLVHAGAYLRTYTLRPAADPVGMAVLLCTYIVLGGVILLGHRRRRRELLYEKGVAMPPPKVAPPATPQVTTAAPAVDQGPYRSQQQQQQQSDDPDAHLVLPAAEQAALERRGIVAVLALFAAAAVLAIGAGGRVTCPVPFYLMQWGMVWTSIAWLFVTRQKTRWYLPALIVASAPVLCLFDLHLGYHAHLTAAHMQVRSAAARLLDRLAGSFWMVLLCIEWLRVLFTGPSSRSVRSRHDPRRPDFHEFEDQKIQPIQGGL